MVPPVLPRLPGSPRESEISRLHVSSLHLLPQSLSQPLSFNLEGLPKVLGRVSAQLPPNGIAGPSQACRQEGGPWGVLSRTPLQEAARPSICF